MNLTDADLSKINLNRNKSVPHYELPFIKITIAGRKGETTHIIRKLNKSKNHINKHVDQLLYTGFNGTLEDFYKVYGKNEEIKKRIPKTKIKLNNSLLLKSDLLYKPIQKTITKEFNFMNKNKINNMKSLLFLLRKKDFCKNNFEKVKENLRNKNHYNKKSNICKANSSQPNFNKDNIYDKQKIKYVKMKKIYKIRKLLNEKSRNVLKNDTNFDFQKSTFETMEENKENEENVKKTNLNRIEMIKSLLEKSEKKKKKNNSIEYVNETFNKFLNKKDDDKIQFKKILDPLSKGFKGNLKEVKRFEGKEKYNIWIKKSTANLVSFGNSFLLMADDTFYKDHKRIISKYPDIERQADIIIPENKVRVDNTIINKIEENEKKIRNILHDNDTLLNHIKEKYLEAKNKKYSKSQHLIYKKRK